MSQVTTSKIFQSPVRLIAALGLIPAATVAIAAVFGLQHFRSPVIVPGRAACTLILLILTGSQLALVWRVGQRRDRFFLAGNLPWRQFAKAGLVLVTGLATVACVIGQSRGGQFALAIGLASLGAIILLPLAAPAEVLQFWGRLVGCRWVRKPALVAYSIAISALAAETVLQALAWFPIGHATQSSDRVTQASLLGVDQFLSIGEAPAHSEWDDHDESFRLAVVGSPEATSELSGELTAGADTTELPFSLQVFTTGPAGPSIDSAAEHATSASPDLVLAVVSIGDDFVEPMRRDWLTWRNLQTPKFVASLLGYEIERPERSTIAAFEKLAACQKNLTAGMRRQWQQTSDRLATLSARCKAEQTSFAVVVLPAKYQLSRAACDELLHQAGCDREAIDLELPQRRLAVIAQQQQIPVLDLTSELKTIGRPLYQKSGDNLNQDGRIVVQQAMGDWVQRSFASDRLLLADLRGAK